MEAKRFDGWTRRRAALGFGGLVAGLLGAATGEGAGAKKGKKKPRKPNCDAKKRKECRRQDRVCDKGKCVVACNAGNSVCRGNQVVQLCGGGQAFCACSPLAAGGFACAATLPETCPAASECASSAQCASDEVCVDGSGAACCGGEAFGVCRRQCRDGNPGL